MLHSPSAKPLRPRLASCLSTCPTVHRARLQHSLLGKAAAGSSAQIASHSSQDRGPTGQAGEPLGRCSQGPHGGSGRVPFPREGKRDLQGLQALQVTTSFHYNTPFGGENTCKSPDLSPYLYTEDQMQAFLRTQRMFSLFFQRPAA